jgi:hypothetical protein
MVPFLAAPDTKLTALPDSYPTYVTADVYNSMHSSVTTWPDGRAMWQAVTWNTFDNRTIYRSDWWWNVDYGGPS